MNFYAEKREMHKTVPVKYIDGTLVEIDEEIADLLKLMWKLGIETSSCCQNGAEGGYPNNNGIYIQFDNGESALKFINIVASYGSPELWYAVYYEKGFSFEINIPDRNYAMRHDKGAAPHFYFNVNMTFEPEYKLQVMEKLSKKIEETFFYCLQSRFGRYKRLLGYYNILYFDLTEGAIWTIFLS